jgi:hypothetical protein
VLVFTYMGAKEQDMQRCRNVAPSSAAPARL